MRSDVAKKRNSDQMALGILHKEGIYGTEDLEEAAVTKSGELNPPFERRDDGFDAWT